MRALTLVTLALAPWPVTANGFDQETFRHWVDMRSGGDGEPVYWYAVGEVFRYTAGELLMTVEGVDTARTLWDDSNADMACQLSRKTFVYRGAETGEVLRDCQGKPVRQIEYPCQFITCELAANRLRTYVEQGAGAMMSRIGPEEDRRARQVGDGILYSAPLFLDMEICGQPYPAIEHYEFIDKPGTDAVPECSWVRYGDLPPWAGGGPSIMHMVTWRIDVYDELPASLRDYLDSEAQLWKPPPADLAEIRSLQE